MTEKHWFIFRGDHHLGPFSFQEILDKVKLDQIDDDELTWCEGNGDWMPLKDQPQIIEALQSEHSQKQQELEKVERQQLQVERQRQEELIAKQAEQERIAKEKAAMEEGRREAARQKARAEEPPPLPPLPIDDEDDEVPPSFDPPDSIDDEVIDDEELDHAISDQVTKSLMDAANKEHQEEKLEVMTFVTKEVHPQGKEYDQEYDEEDSEGEFDEDTGEYNVAGELADDSDDLEYDLEYDEDEFYESESVEQVPAGARFYGALALSVLGLGLLIYVVTQMTSGQRRLFNVAGRDKDALYNVMNRPFRGEPIHRLRPTKDLNSIWFATNFPDEAILYMTLKSIPGRSLGQGEVEVQAVAKLQGGAALFDKLEVLKGETLHVGEYAYDIKGVRVGLKGKLSAALGEKSLLNQIKFLRTRDQEFQMKGTLLLSPYGSDEFSKRLKEQQVFVSKTVVRPLKDHLQRYQTFLGLLERLDNLYQSIMRRITKGKSIKMFEDRYNEEVGPFLRDLIIDCNRLYLSLVNLRPEQSKAYEELMNYGKDIGYTASEMVTKTRKVRKLTKEKTDWLISHFEKEVQDLRLKGQRQKRFIELKLAPFSEGKSDDKNPTESRPADPAP